MKEPQPQLFGDPTSDSTPGPETPVADPSTGTAAPGSELPRTDYQALAEERLRRISDGRREGDMKLQQTGMPSAPPEVEPTDEPTDEVDSAAADAAKRVVEPAGPSDEETEETPNAIYTPHPPSEEERAATHEVVAAAKIDVAKGQQAARDHEESVAAKQKQR